MMFQAVKSEIVSHISYIIRSKNEIAVIDPRRDCQVYLETAAKWGAKIKYILETHRNEDYVIGSLELANVSNARIFHGPGLSWKYGEIIEDKQELPLGALRIEALHTPGHSIDSTCYAVSDLESGKKVVLVFTGDTLLVGDVGRTDFLGAEMTPVMAEKMYDSIMSKLIPLGEDVIVCPSHGAGSVCGAKIRQREISTIGIEKTTNPMLKLDKKEFVSYKVNEKNQSPPYFKQMEKYNLEGPPVLGNVPHLKALSALEFAEISKNAYIIDTRSPVAFGGAHIEGSYSLTPSRLSNIGWVANYEKPILLVVETLEALDFATRNLFRLGYDRIEGYLTGGLEEWYKEGLSLSRVNLISVIDLEKMLASKQELLIVDVRRDVEWIEGHIEGSKHIYLGSLQNQVEQLPRDIPLVVLCKTGNRSSFGASVLLRAGFKHVYNCLGGTDAWIKSGFPLVK